MPQYIKDPEGNLHTFEDNATSDQINAQMSTYWQKKQATPKVEPSIPGAKPGGMQPQEGAPDLSMVPLSDEAERYKRMSVVGGMMGNRALGMAGSNLYEHDPTYIARSAAAKGAGEQAATLAGKQGAGKRVYSAVDELEQKAKAWLDHVPKGFNGAIGPYNSNPAYQRWTGTLPVFGNDAAYDFHSIMNHDIHKLTALYREMPSSGKGSGSDAQDATFFEAMGAAQKAQSPEAFFAIMQSAKQLVRDKAGLPHAFDLRRAPLHPTDVVAINKYAGSKPITEGSPYMPYRVKGPEDAAKLPPGSHYLTPDGQLYKR